MRYKKFVFLCLILLSSISSGKCERVFERWLNAGHTWYESWMRAADEAGPMGTAERMENLSSALSFARDVPLDGEKKEIYDRVRKILIETPGHAEYIAARLRASYAYDEWRLKDQKSDEPKPETTIADLQSPARECQYGFEALAQLPTPETVKVLGEFLDDELGMKELLAAEAIREESKKLSELHAGNRAEWSKVDGIIDDSIIHPAVAVEAASTLGRLPLKSKPKIKVRTVEDLQVWKNWYQQIKEGRRTFSFEGDPREYDLTGPVREARNPDIARVTKRPGGLEGVSQAQPAASIQSATPWVVGIAVLIVGFGAYVYRLKKR